MNLFFLWAVLSEFSSLRKLQMEKYRMQEVLIDRKCAAPRFVIKPQSHFRDRGKFCKSVKYMKRYIGDDYTFIINRVKVADRGEFIIRAENHYGVTEEPVFLNVQPSPQELPRYTPDPLPQRKRQPRTYKLFKQERSTAPMFTFHLRPRVIQEGQTCKLLACLSGHPHPTIKWMKGGKELDAGKYPITHTDGVITIEIINAQPSDSGKYRCVASNDLGSDASECVVICEGPNMSDEQMSMSSSILYSDHRYISAYSGK
ncbi:Twitchin [Lepeophtheirus salmonis]|uniref:Twitchin n=1 Tax=Lepeophtheirus salmonis TaxID=72036 RepID=A0A7R8H7Z8_LEPSM|nr:Twitchin [Lepeophtheirus salmonis]CAF2920657.1 Twitchin [Lepeophtheirus salmonis]